MLQPPVSLAGFLQSEQFYLFQIHLREIMWHQPTLRYLTIVVLNMSNVVVRILCFESLLGCDQTDRWDWFSGCWQKGNSNVKVVAKLQTEVMNALNSTFTEADWPKGTKKGTEFFSLQNLTNLSHLDFRMALQLRWIYIPWLVYGEINPYSQSSCSNFLRVRHSNHSPGLLKKWQCEKWVSQQCGKSGMAAENV